MNKNMNGGGTGPLPQGDMRDIDNISNMPDVSPDQPLGGSSSESGHGRGKSDKRQKACSISCAAGGIVSAAAIISCTAAVCVLYGTGALSTYAVGFPHGTSISSISTSVDDTGRPVVDAYLSRPQESDASNVPGISDNISSVPDDISSISDDISSIPDNISSIPDDISSVPDDISDTSDISNTSQPGISGSGDPNTHNPMPDTGEDPPTRITALMEIEILRARDRRISDGLAPYPSTDTAVPASAGISAIAAEYGFTEEFVRAYNSGEGAIPGIIMIPAI